MQKTIIEKIWEQHIVYEEQGKAGPPIYRSSFIARSYFSPSI